MSLDQDKLGEGKSKTKGSRPPHKYLADSINLESVKWASAGLASLEKEYRSAKSEEKRSRIIQTINEAIIRSELEATNPSISQKRKKELNKIQAELRSRRYKLVGEKQVARATEKSPQFEKTPAVEIPVTQKPKKKESPDIGVVVRKIKRTENVGQLYGLMDRLDKEENINRTTPEIETAYQKQMKKFGYELRDIPEVQYETGQVFLDLERARDAAKQLDTKTGREHNIEMIELGKYKVIESERSQMTEQERNAEKARLVRKRLDELEHRIDVVKKAVDDARKQSKTSEFHKGRYRKGLDNLRAMERERQNILDQVKHFERQAQGPEYEVKLEQLEKMDKAVAAAKHLYFSATAVERRQLSIKEKKGLIYVLETHHELQKSMGIKPYALDEDMLTKIKTSVGTHDYSKDRERTAYRVKSKRGYSRVVELEAEDFKRPKQFHERPTAGKKFTDLKGLGTDYYIWELSEYEYHRWKHFRDIREAQGQVEYRQKLLDDKRSDGKHTLRGQKREMELGALDYWKKQQKKLNETTPEESWKKKTSTPETYTETVKKAIKSGKPVPQDVIDQYSEFKKAEDSRERYEKGRHTSFANRSIAINESMREERGFKVKRQDGKAITPKQIEEISAGVSEIESVLGSMDDMFRHTDLTIAHTSGKHPFLSQAGGQYSIFDTTVTMGTKNVPSLAHEIGHWLDFESGKAYKKAVEVKRGKKYVKLSSIAEINTAENKDDLITQATLRMNDVQETERIMKTKLKTIADPKEKKRIQTTKVKLGTYWYEPNEIWARVFEQYLATEAAERGGNPTISSWNKQMYNKQPAYWREEDFEVLRPMMEKQIQERIAILRAKGLEVESKQ